jgi:hypothetical protein
MQRTADEVRGVARGADDVEAGQATRRGRMALLQHQSPALLHTCRRHVGLDQRREVQLRPVLYEERVRHECQIGVGCRQSRQITRLAGVVHGREAAGGPTGRGGERRGEFSYKRLGIGAGTGIAGSAEHQQ